MSENEPISLIKRARRVVIRLLDRPGGRTLLGALATALARRNHKTARVYYQSGTWVRELDGVRLVDGPTFAYYTQQLTRFDISFRTRRVLAETIWFAAYTPGEGDTVIDLGAAWGGTTSLLSRAVGNSGTVLAIEAQPQSFEFLEKTVALNHMANTVCVNLAVLAEPGEVTIEDREDHASNRIDPERGTGDVVVKGDSLDNICEAQGIDTVDFMLMNIEGAERLAIQGMTRLLPRLRNVCIFCHDFIANETGTEWYRTREIVLEFLRSNDFEITTFESHQHVPVRDAVVGSRPDPGR